MTDEDFERIRAVVREVVAPVLADIAEIRAVQAEHTRDIALLRQDVIQVRNSLGMMEDKIEIMTGVSVRLDGTAQEVSGIRRMLDHLDRRVRKLEDQTPAIAP
jgi:hypothetical protein